MNWLIRTIVPNCIELQLAAQLLRQDLGNGLLWWYVDIQSLSLLKVPTYQRAGPYNDLPLRRVGAFACPLLYIQSVHIINTRIQMVQPQSVCEGNRNVAGSCHTYVPPWERLMCWVIVRKYRMLAIYVSGIPLWRTPSVTAVLAWIPS